MSTNPNVRYFDEYKLGETFETNGITIDQGDISQYAGISGDFSPLHTDAEFAKTTPFGGRIAHGLLVVTKIVGKFNQLGYWDGAVMALLETGWTFLKPVKPGDTIFAKVTVANLKEAKSRDRGVITIKLEVINQRAEKTADGILKLLLKKKD